MSAPVPASPDLAARSYLYVPADREDHLAKALTRGADALIVDLEDAVAPAAKDRARAVAGAWLARQRGAGAQLWVRINAPAAATDIAAVVPALSAAHASGAVTGLVVPKAEPALLAEVDMLLGRHERAHRLPAGTVRVIALVETARGLLSVAELAMAPRVLRLGLGEADLTAELGLTPDPARHELLPLRLQLVLASAAAGILAPVAAASLDLRDPDAVHTSTEAARRLGFRARTAVHPAQVAVINEVFTPTAEDVAAAREIVEAFEAAERAGTGVITDPAGRMVDLAVVRSAREVLGRAARSS